MKYKKYIIWGVCAAIVILAAGYLFKNKENNSSANRDSFVSFSTIRVGYRAHDMHAPLFVGIEKNFFTQNNLQIAPVKFESTNQLMDALLAGQIDAALGGVNTPILLSIENKSAGEFKIFGLANETADVPASYLLVKKDSSIKNISDLKNKKIAIMPGSTGRLILKKTLEKYFDPALAQMQAMDAKLELPALESGQIDAAIVLEPLGTVAQEKQIAKVLDSALFSKYMVQDMPLAASVVSTRYANSHKAETKKFIIAANMAIDYINDPKNTKEVKSIIAKYTNLDAAVVDKLITPTFYKLNEINKNKFQELADYLFSEKELTKKINVDSLLAQEKDL